MAAAALLPPAAEAITFDGDISYTSDYILRGVSETGGRSAGQIDVRLTTADGTFAGVFGTTLNRVPAGYVSRGWQYQVEEYLGHHFDLSPSWTTTLTAVNYSYLKGNVPQSIDYQEISVAVSYLDFWTVTVAAIPNAVRWEGHYRLGRYAAYALDNSVQIPILGRLFATGGVGYYTTDDTGYAYGNAGLAFEFNSLRLEAGYYVAQDHAQDLFPYGRAGNRFAAAVLWHF